MIYYMDNAEHCEEIWRLAREGGHCVWVQESKDLGKPLYLANLRIDEFNGGTIVGDANVTPPDKTTPTPVASA